MNQTSKYNLKQLKLINLTNFQVNTNKKFMESKNQGFVKSQTEGIIIYVSSPLLDTAKSFFTYLVSGNDTNGPIEIRRRFNDFYYLRESLRKKWPGLYIPPVPEKMITGNKDEGNIEMRKRYFEYFLQGIAKRPQLFNCGITQEFLRNKTLDMQKFYTSFLYPKPQESIHEYKGLYTELQNFQEDKQFPTVEQKKVLSDFMVYLKKADKELKNMRGMIQGIIDSRNMFMNNLNIVTTTMLPEYQKNIYSQYLTENQSKQQMLFASRPKVQQSAYKIKQVSQNNSFQACLDMIAYEVLQVESMQELLTDRDNFEAHFFKCNEKMLSAESELSKLMGGKTTLKSIFSKGNKDEQIKNLQREVPLMRQQAEYWRRLVVLITILIAQREIPKFKRQKQLKYYDVMHHTSQKELNYLVVYGDLMKSLMQGIVKSK